MVIVEYVKKELAALMLIVMVLRDMVTMELENQSMRTITGRIELGSTTEKLSGRNKIPCALRLSVNYVL